MYHHSKPAELKHRESAGLTSLQVVERQVKYGKNVVDQSKPAGTLALMSRSLFEPFNGLMLVVAILTAVPPNSAYSTFALIMVCLATSCWLNLGCFCCATPFASTPAQCRNDTSRVPAQSCTLKYVSPVLECCLSYGRDMAFGSQTLCYISECLCRSYCLLRWDCAFGMNCAAVLSIILWPPHSLPVPAYCATTPRNQLTLRTLCLATL